MLQHKINITFNCLTIQKLPVTMIIRKCIEATLQAEGIEIPCEINVLVTDDKEIRGAGLSYVFS